MEEKLDKPTQVCRDKDFNVATNCSASDTEYSLGSARQPDYVATKENIVATEIEQNHQCMLQHRKEGYNEVEELEAENSLATKENYVTTEDGEERTEECRDTIGTRKS